MTAVVVVAPDELDGGWVAECINLPGCMSQGDTEEEALENLMDAMGGVLAARMHAQLRETLPRLHREPTDSSEHQHEIALSV